MTFKIYINGGLERYSSRCKEPCCQRTGMITTSISHNLPDPIGEEVIKYQVMVPLLAGVIWTSWPLLDIYIWQIERTIMATNRTSNIFD